MLVDGYITGKDKPFNLVYMDHIGPARNVRYFAKSSDAISGHLHLFGKVVAIVPTTFDSVSGFKKSHLVAIPFTLHSHFHSAESREVKIPVHNL